jgi:hypothetical protein
MPIISSTQEAEIRRILVQSQPRKIVHKTLSRKNPPPQKKSMVVPQKNQKQKYHMIQQFH